MNTETRPSSIEKLYYVVHKLNNYFSSGLNKSQNSRNLGIYRGTVRRFRQSSAHQGSPKSSMAGGETGFGSVLSCRTDGDRLW